MRIVCKNGERIIVEEGEKFMPNHVKDFEEALKECGIEEIAWLSYPRRFNDSVPQGGIGVFGYQNNIIITEDTMSDEWVIGIGDKNDVKSLYDRVAEKLLKDRTGRDREDTEYVLNQLKEVLGIK